MLVGLGICESVLWNSCFSVVFGLFGVCWSGLWLGWRLVCCILVRFYLCWVCVWFGWVVVLFGVGYWWLVCVLVCCWYGFLLGLLFGVFVLFVFNCVGRCDCWDIGFYWVDDVYVDVLEDCCG